MTLETSEIASELLYSLNNGRVDRDRLREEVLIHLDHLGLPGTNGSTPLTKLQIREMHRTQRQGARQRIVHALSRRFDRLVEEFADGNEVDPSSIEPKLVPAQSDHVTGDLFRFATLLWSVPVSQGFGRRMRYLVKDRANGKLIGLFALGDPVFNLRARDNWIGWRVDDRQERLVNVMDAYVLGAVPPYSHLLGGKLVTSLVGSAEVGEAFEKKYGDNVGIISGKRKPARLSLITVTSALGRSSIYNRLKLLRLPTRGKPETAVQLIKVGTTVGYGHFQLTDDLFLHLRELLREEGHAYGDGHQFGQGPNWRMRVLRVALGMLDLDPELLRHGIKREVYVMPIARNYREFLCGLTANAEIDSPKIQEISTLAKERWIIPRARRRGDYLNFRRSDLLQTIGHEK